MSVQVMNGPAVADPSVDESLRELGLDGLGLDLDLETESVSAASAMPWNREPVQEDPPFPREPVAKQSRVEEAGKGDILFFDLETIPDYSMVNLAHTQIPVEQPVALFSELIPPAELVKKTLAEIKAYIPTINPPEEWVTELVKIEQETQKKGARAGLMDLLAKCRTSAEIVEDALKQRSKEMATTPELCRIVALGFAVGDGEVGALVADEPDDEHEGMLLDSFWRLAAGAKLVCGYNVLGFDLPTVIARSIIRGIVPPRKFDLSRWGGDVLDLMLKRYPGGKSEAKSLKMLCKMYGIQPPAGDMEGSKVEAVYEQDRGKILEYVRSDVVVARELYRKLKMGFF